MLSPVRSRGAARHTAVVLACALAAACGREVEQAPPVAMPTVSLSRTDAAVGSPVDVTYRFVVAADAPAFAEDYLVFAHFLNPDRDLMWTDDHAPVTPTSQWKPGATIEYARTMFVPKFPYVGETWVEVGLYSPKTGERLPLSGTDTGMRSYRVATFNMRLQSDNIFVVFKDGWHDTEVSEDGALEWQWSRREGTLSFRNPKRDVVLLLQVDQAVQALPDPQRVEVRLGGATVDSFGLPPGNRELRRIPLSAAQLGGGETVDMAIVVDKTFVPSAVPQLRSGDARELGIRVFRAYVEPK